MSAQDGRDKKFFQKLVINLEFISFYLIQLSRFKIFQIN